jgi:uncharacterized protein (DUF1015 family)
MREVSWEIYGITVNSPEQVYRLMPGVPVQVKIYRFAGVRPIRAAAQDIAAVPYDVVTAGEAKAIIAKNPRSFLRVSRPDAEMPEIPAYDARVYEKAAENFNNLGAEGLLQKDNSRSLYLYRVRQNGDTFLGLCCCLDVETTGTIQSAGMNRHATIRRRTVPAISRQQKPITDRSSFSAGTRVPFFRS